MNQKCKKQCVMQSFTLGIPCNGYSGRPLPRIRCHLSSVKKQRATAIGTASLSAAIATKPAAVIRPLLSALRERRHDALRSWPMVFSSEIDAFPALRQQSRIRQISGLCHPLHNLCQFLGISVDDNSTIHFADC